MMVAAIKIMIWRLRERFAATSAPAFPSVTPSVAIPGGSLFCFVLVCILIDYSIHILSIRSNLLPQSFPILDGHPSYLRPQRLLSAPCVSMAPAWESPGVFWLTLH